MYVPDAMKLNKLRYVKVLSPREMFKQFGFRPASVYSGESVVPLGARKIDTLNSLEALDNKAWVEESRPQPVIENVVENDSE